MNTPTIRVVPGGLLTTGFSERRARRKNLQRQFTTCDTAMKNTSNPEWMRLPRMCRLTHDELERWTGRNVSGARITGAKRFTRSDWHAVGGTERLWVDRLVAAGWADWEGEDLILLGVDLDGEQGFIARVAEKKLAGRRTRLGGENRSPHAGVAKIAPCQVAETSHFEDTAPAPAEDLSEIRSDLRSSSVSQASPPPPPTRGGVAAGAAGGGGGLKAGKRAEPDGFAEWLQRYASTPKPEIRARLTGVKVVSEARRTWAELAMTATGIKRLATFTDHKLREPMYARQDGRFRYPPGKFLSEVWRPELLELRKKTATARGETGVAATASTMSAYLEMLGGQA